MQTVTIGLFGVSVQTMLLKYSVRQDGGLKS